MREKREKGERGWEGEGEREELKEWLHNVLSCIILKTQIPLSC